MMWDDSIGSLSAIFQKVKKMLHMDKDITYSCRKSDQSSNSVITYAKSIGTIQGNRYDTRRNPAIYSWLAQKYCEY